MIDQTLLDIDKLIKEDPYIRINSNFTQKILQDLLLITKRQEMMEQHIQNLNNQIKLLSGYNRRPSEQKVQCECGIFIIRRRLDQHQRTNKHKYNLNHKPSNKIFH